MSTSVAAPEILVRVELTCFYCGHGYGEFKVRTTGRPTYRDLRRAIEEAAPANPPAWDERGEPRCPRCGGKLFVEESDRRLSPARG
jgi:DNA-directed RNA polymerase subunit RPC12/RpoP